MSPGDFTRATVTVDPRVGGGFRIVMEEGTDGGDYEHRGSRPSPSATTTNDIECGCSIRR